MSERFTLHFSMNISADAINERVNKRRPMPSLPNLSIHMPHMNVPRDAPMSHIIEVIDCMRALKLTGLFAAINTPDDIDSSISPDVHIMVSRMSDGNPLTRLIPPKPTANVMPASAMIESWCRCLTAAVMSSVSASTVMAFTLIMIP